MKCWNNKFQIVSTLMTGFLFLEGHVDRSSQSATIAPSPAQISRIDALKLKKQFLEGKNRLNCMFQSAKKYKNYIKVHIG